MNLPEIFSGPITQAKWRELGRYLTGGVIRGGSGVRVRNVGGKTIISRVKARPPGPSDAAEDPPFLIRCSIDPDTSELRLYVSKGRLTALSWLEGDAFPRFEEMLVTIGSGRLTGDAFSPYVTDGFQVLSPSTTYGVWVSLARFTNETFGDGPTSLYWEKFTVYSHRTGTIVTSSTYTDPEDGPDFTDASTGAPPMIYLGRVTVDAESGFTISQYRRSDIVLPAFGMPQIFLSQDAGNIIGPGTDGGIFAEAP